MINNFICDNCDHHLVCEKLSKLMKFHESAKKDLGITLTMESCLDFSGHDEKDEQDNADED